MSSSVASEKSESHLNSKARGSSNKARGIRFPSSSTNANLSRGMGSTSGVSKEGMNSERTHFSLSVIFQSTEQR